MPLLVYFKDHIWINAIAFLYFKDHIWINAIAFLL